MSENKTSSNSNKNLLYLIVGILVISSLAFRLINYAQFEQTSILFVGLPALITILIIKYDNTPKSAYGVAFKVVTLFLLMSAILLGEGVVCVLFAAPIFYGVSALIVFVHEYLKKINSDKDYSLILIPIVLLIMQPLGIKTIPEENIVVTTVELPSSVSLLDLNKVPDFQKNYPSLFKIGFPKPLDIKGSGLHVGDQRHISFESTTKGIGVLSLEIDSATEKTISFKIDKDETHISHWLTWKKVSVNVEKQQDKSIVTWTSVYTCDLGPQWYFNPLEKIAVKEMNKHLINSYFNEN